MDSGAAKTGQRYQPNKGQLHLTMLLSKAGLGAVRHFCLFNDVDVLGTGMLGLYLCCSIQIVLDRCYVNR